ncbi:MULTISPECIES: class I SAM-dependent methyltransferase [unclassified Ruegeria]|uniref:class I SAM-dependent methyltransferase n=1 Tax=unclassified Ruegeria TaxID=2625375 RepID=UPI0014885D87|nr:MULTISPECIES: class I SAM-dependent methyltransferase [unclassified Ruegeria]NOD36242.1 hypothetical protein [Ruegeria sp. HKCCD7296]NOD47352.1 hypothetical protein [Ruegeria sp. HKCCD5849]NOD53255.1 hypothetical protein [Ruegeria sp. HKCCD5851]NOD66448.1 hypothetical protein [Ruegeria sp. HKCCD7303]NOE34062.1 hypothetical protein [Ruegeria sp. HKCCD7318]
MPNLTQLAKKHGTDKGLTDLAHGYTRLYELLFHPLRDKPIRLLEMGLLRGGPEVRGRRADRETDRVPSVDMWLEYFEHAHVTGLDISDFSWRKGPRFDFVQCDMEKRENIKAAAAQFEQPFDVIIDDASHASHHQQFALLEMWPKLKDGGIYIIEDLHWQPGTFENPDFPKTGDLFHDFQRTRRFAHSDQEIERDLNALADEIGFAFVFPDKFKRRGAPKILAMQKVLGQYD